MGSRLGLELGRARNRIGYLPDDTHRLLMQKLYNRGMKPVYKDSTMTTFARIPGTSTFTGEGKDSGSSLKWQHQFKSSGPVFFAFCFPYTVTDMEVNVGVRIGIGTIVRLGSESMWE